MGNMVEVKVPDIGDFKDVEVIELLVAPGDRIKPEQSLITVESDKASMEIPSPMAGIVREVRVKLGDKVSEGSPILALEPGDEAAAAPKRPEAAPAPAAAGPAPKPAPAPAPTPAPAAPLAAAAGSPPSTAFATEMGAPPGSDLAHATSPRAHASPSVRRFGRELGVDLNQVKGSGPKGRILPDDVRGFVKAALASAGRPAVAPAAAGLGFNLPPWPQVDFAKFGPIERVELSRIRKLAGPNLHRNWVSIPHVTNHDDADVTDLEAFRVQLNKENERSGVKVTMLAFLIKACVATLKKFPAFNSSIDPAGDALILKRYFHIGFAADTPSGLVVPVVRDADRKGVLELATETAALAGKAREGKLTPSEMQGGTFTISSLGGIGGTYFTPIISAPEVAILGVCRTATRPVWDGRQFAPRLILPLSLSWDHRVVDGAAAARFNSYLAQVLADFRRVLL
ncbi:MAG TPA: dihydrolipoyllysine-residue acetyltransferase [Burkholderiaceae bacterium]|nr:dihydrolipoyllysine-residue acetyltransferase [Burkholderiaceae bacterium]